MNLFHGLFLRIIPKIPLITDARMSNPKLRNGFRSQSV